MVEAAAKSAGIKCSEIFLKEWGCSGEQLPTLEDLQSILIDKQLFGAADYVAKLLDGMDHVFKPLHLCLLGMCF